MLQIDRIRILGLRAGGKFFCGCGRADIESCGRGRAVIKSCGQADVEFSALVITKVKHRKILTIYVVFKQSF